MRAVTCAMIVIVLSAAGAAAQDPTGLPPRGAGNAAVEIVAFCDFESEPCARIAVVLHALLTKLPEDVRLAFRHVARDDQPHSAVAYAAVLAAAEQQRGWDMWDMVFANQDRLTREGLLSMAAQLQLDPERFAAALDGVAAQRVLDADRAEAAAQEIASGPVLLLNGKRLSGVNTLDQLMALVRQARELQ